jgi:hypothetical protein
VVVEEMLMMQSTEKLAESEQMTSVASLPELTLQKKKGHLYYRLVTWGYGKVYQVQMARITGW